MHRNDHRRSFTKRQINPLIQAVVMIFNIVAVSTSLWLSTVFNSAARSFYLYTRNSDKQNEINISEFSHFRL